MPSKGVLFTYLKIVDPYNQSCNIFSIYIRRCYSKSTNRNPYDILGVKSTCSTQDIKKAYIKLCKELHPDMKPGDTSQHKKFVELNNAYTVLMNAESRRNLNNKSYSTPYEEYNWKYKWTYKPYNQDTERKEKAWYEQEEYRKFYRHPHNTQNHRQLNFGWTLFGCLVLVIVGSILTYFAYRYAVHYMLNIVDKKSRKISENYKEVRKNALRGSKEEKSEALKKKWNL